MRNNGFKKNSGFAIVIVLAALVILMLLYFIDIKALFGPSLNAKKGSAPQSRPWLEEDLILGPDKLITLPKPPKPSLDEALTITAFVSRGEDERGEMVLEFNTQGEVSGSWSCEYSHDQKDYSIEAAFAGNIDVEKTYYRIPPTRATRKPQDPDDSMLYFITKGEYTQKDYNNETGRLTETQGLIYITGWLSPDCSADGLITITTDKKWSETYNWQSQ